MVDRERVCCMCGDVGFPDKLFQCSRCRFRFQHSYCSNYYCGDEIPSSTTAIKELCDWCQSEGRNSTSRNHGSGSSKKSSSDNKFHLHIRSEYSTVERIKQQHEDQQDHGNAAVTSATGEKGITTSKSNSGGVPSPRTGAHRRYKLLKDVMC